MKINLKFPKFKSKPKTQKVAKTKSGKSSKTETTVMSKKGLIISSIVAGSAIAAGIAVTLVLINPNLFPPVAPNYADMDVKELDDDINSLMKKYSRQAEGTDYTTVFKPYELANIALKNAETSDHFHTTQTGSVKASIATQSVNATFIKNGNKMFYENISTSAFVQVGIRFYQDESNVEIHTLRGGEVQQDKVNWSSASIENITPSQYEENWGKDLTRKSIFVVSSKTSLSSSSAVKTVDGYEVNVDLDPVLGAARYVKQIILTSGLDKTPVFSKISLTYYLDENLKLQRVVSHCEYTVYVVTWVDSIETLDEYYSYDDLAIPSITEDCVY